MKRVIKHVPMLLKRPILSPLVALRTVTSKSGLGVYASSDTLFKGAVFGRDSLEVAEDMLFVYPRLARRILLTLAALQGLHSSDINEEEPGKIIHEYRTRTVDGKPLDDISRHIFEELSSRWGGDDHQMAYYGSIDATPHFIRTVGLYTDHKGRTLLDHMVTRRDGTKVTLKQSVEAAVDWLMNKLADSRSGLLEYHRRNPLGIENQVWKDSHEFYVHANGELANHNQPIASIEVQGLAYDALMTATEFFPERAKELKQRAQKLRDKTIELLWMPRKNYFAVGLDYRDDGKQRCIKITTANPAALLDTKFFDDLSERERKKYIKGIVSNIMGTDFLTDAGIRSRSIREGHLIKFWDYHGSYTSWPKETYDIAKGLRRQGFPKLAEQLENRLLNVIRKSRSYPEFVYVDYRGRVLAGPPSARLHGTLMLVDSTNEPEAIQAWTVSAVLAISASRLPSFRRRRRRQQPWQVRLERQVLSHIPYIKPLRGSKELSARYPDYPYKLVNGNSKKAGSFLHIEIKKTPGR